MQVHSSRELQGEELVVSASGSEIPPRERAKKVIGLVFLFSGSPVTIFSEDGE